MAKEAVQADATEAPKRTRRAPEGPRKIKPVHAAITVHDAEGNPVPGGSIKVHKTSKDFETVYAAKEADPSVSLVRIPLDSLT